jgi:hypothetical protein
LRPSTRRAGGDRGRMRSISDEQIDALMKLRSENPKLSTPRLVEKAYSEGVFPPGSEVSMASVYRLLKIRESQASEGRAGYAQI